MQKKIAQLSSINLATSIVAATALYCLLSAPSLNFFEDLLRVMRNFFEDLLRVVRDFFEVVLFCLTQIFSPKKFQYEGGIISKFSERLD